MMTHASLAKSALVGATPFAWIRSGAASPIVAAALFGPDAQNRCRYSTRGQQRHSASGILDLVDDPASSVGCADLVDLGHAEFLEHVARTRVRRVAQTEQTRAVQTAEADLEQFLSNLGGVAATLVLAAKHESDLQIAQKVFA